MSLAERVGHHPALGRAFLRSRPLLLVKTCRPNPTYTHSPRKTPPSWRFCRWESSTFLKQPGIFPPRPHPTVLNAYLSGRSYRRALANLENDAYDFSAHQPYIVPHQHRDEKHFLYCTFTKATLPRQTHTVQNHVPSKRFVSKKKNPAVGKAVLGKRNRIKIALPKKVLRARQRRNTAIGHVPDVVMVYKCLLAFLLSSVFHDTFCRSSPRAFVVPPSLVISSSSTIQFPLAPCKCVFVIQMFALKVPTPRT